MKIPTINSFMSLNRHSNCNEKKNTFTFNALDSNKLKKFPIEKKLSYLFSILDPGDVLVLAKNKKELQNGLQRTISTYGEVIKRILFIKHGGISVPLAFSIDAMFKNSIFCSNIGEKPVLIATDSTTEELTPSSSLTIENGDVIINNKVNIPIDTFADIRESAEDNNDLDVLLNAENYVNETYDFEEMQQEKIEKANREALKALSVEREANTQSQASKQLSFSNIGGMDGVIEELKRSVVYPIKYPFAYDNIALNKGIILYGPPGTGKTLLAESLANEIDGNFLKVGATELESKWVGESEANWRKLFNTAIETQPAVIFIDEIDAAAKERGHAGGSDHDAKVVNQILTLMSDLEKSKNQVFVIAATNKKDLIDGAFKRSGRFGKHIEIPLPNKEALKDIWKIHTKDRLIDPEFNEEAFVELLEKEKMTGADIKQIVNEAHIKSWERYGIYEKMEAKTLTKDDIIEALIKEEDIMAAFKQIKSAQSKPTIDRIGFVK